MILYEDIKNKIINLVKDTRTMTVNEAVTYIKEIFPEPEFVWKKKNDSYDIYVDRVDTLYIPCENLNTLIITYPGGEKYGPYFSQPHTDIHFENNDNSSDVSLFLFKNDKYNNENRIIESLIENTENEKEISSVLFDNNNSEFEYDLASYEKPVEEYMVKSESNTFDEKKELSDEKIEFYKTLELNRDRYIQDIHNKYTLMRNHKEYISIIQSFEDYSMGGDVSYLDSRLENINISKRMSEDMVKLSEINSNINLLTKENEKYELENKELSSKKYSFWQGNQKQRAFDKIESNKVIIAKNNETIEGLVAQQTKMQSIVSIGKAFQNEVSEMINDNPMKGLPHIYKLFINEGNDNLADNYVLYSTDLRNHSEKEYVAMINKKISQHL